MAERGLTPGERLMVSNMFGSGNSINLDKITITDQPLAALLTGSVQDRPMAPYGRIHWPEGMPGFPPSDDFSTASAQMQAVFLHEVTHVWQDQHHQITPSVVFDQLGRIFGTKNPYDMSNVTANSRYDDLNSEQQGEIVK